MASRTAYSTWTPQKPTPFDGHYFRNRSTSFIGVLGYIGIVQHKEHYPEFCPFFLGHPVYIYIYNYFILWKKSINLMSLEKQILLSHLWQTVWNAQLRNNI